MEITLKETLSNGRYYLVDSIKNKLINIGWSIVDSSGGTVGQDPEDAWFVAHSSGEDGQEALYVRFSFTATGIELLGYLFWDSSLRMGYDGYGQSIENLTMTTGYNDCDLMITGDLDSFIIYLTSDDSYRVSYFGKMDVPFEGMSQNKVTTSADVVSGSLVEIPLMSVPTDWTVGTIIYYWTIHNDTAKDIGCGSAKITDIFGSTIVLETMDVDLPLGSVLSDFNGYTIIENITVSYNLYATFMVDYRNRKNIRLGSTYFTTPIAHSDYCDTDLVGSVYIYDSTNEKVILGLIRWIGLASSTTAVDRDTTFMDIDGNTYRFYDNGKDTVIKEF